MKKTLLTLAFAALIAPITAQATEANGIGYTYVQLDYVNANQTGHGTLSDGATLNGSFQFADNFHVFGSYSSLSYRDSFLQDTADLYGLNVYNTSGTEKPWSLGFGYAAAIGNRADWVTQLSYTHDNIKFRGCVDTWGCFSSRDTANVWTINTGVQGRVFDNLTANAYVGYSNAGRHDDNVFGDFGMVYSFNKTWAMHGGVRVNSLSHELYSVGVRASF
ncbi:autotransporter outer membrane beta-barrel domain-containing protein [Dyella sp. C11]|uniref:autotransporter outer membrane beta-barrel domain-containing protein n=1 Tax=Dyella sp. C11 TaxID=2126991 RepID=UPI000D6471A3|nr:autotransporter outer membrane beta-barrel domain-containing protein [Dyella sp. C11]